MDHIDECITTIMELLVQDFGSVLQLHGRYGFELNFLGLCCWNALLTAVMSKMV